MRAPSVGHNPKRGPGNRASAIPEKGGPENHPQPPPKIQIQSFPSSTPLTRPYKYPSSSHFLHPISSFLHLSFTILNPPNHYPIKPSHGVIYRRGFPEDLVSRDGANRAHLDDPSHTGCCPSPSSSSAVLTIAMSRWFERNNRLTTFWYWVPVVAVALAAFGKEYERRALQAFNDRWRPEK
ncbi:hypothetical protein RHMOL_Rhmol07G0203100 [Rhododendron molle]|uniref:Uncharacterized protein n=1 Tax=Rhododendron molle TaxID=49168 RepID=A0ACC0N326_RHOML|nr:hypothetical protein RHMOL_Rhmol07G0203100 [Rhododendron molle]